LSGSPDSHLMPTFPRSLALLAALLLGGGPLAGQAAPSLHLAGQAIGVVTRVEDIPGGGSLAEARVVQPLLLLHGQALDGHLGFTGTLDLEGWTIPDGELTPGAWGEGYNDRRHPHTYAHELLVSVNDLLGRLDGPARISLTLGKGFAPFGSDDPMSRPTVRYPVNHHLSQILERAVGIVGVRVGPVALEGALFNGDEPERPGQWPRLRRFGDSWSSRLTLLPASGVELSVSRARVHSPEHRPGAGTDAHKWHVGGRYEGPVGPGQMYLLAEWARTEEARGFFVFRSLLLEGQYRWGRSRPYYRFERSDRPEDVRTVNPFRSVRPHLENSILGTTRFSLHTLGYGYRFGAAGDRLAIEPFVEATLGSARNVDGGIFTPEVFYGTDRVRSVSAGWRVSWEVMSHRMGRYGGLIEVPTTMMHDGM